MKNPIVIQVEKGDKQVCLLVTSLDKMTSVYDDEFKSGKQKKQVINALRELLFILEG